MTAYDVLGTVTVAEAGEPFTENHTSYAADHRTVKVLPGTYEVRLTKGGSRMVLVTMDAEITDDTTYSGICGNNFASRVVEGPVLGHKTYQMYDYAVAETLCKGTAFMGGEFVFADGASIVVKHSQLPVWDSETRDYHPTATRTYISRKFVVEQPAVVGA